MVAFNPLISLQDDYKFSPYINFVQKLDGSVATIPSLVTQANSPATYHLKLPKHEPFHGNTSSPKLKKEKKKSEKQRRKIAKDDSSQIAKLPITPVPSPVVYTSPETVCTCNPSLVN